MTEIIRILVPIDSHDETAFQTALASAEAICETAGSDVRDIVLLVHGKGQIEQTSLGGFLGPARVKALARGPIALSDGRRLSVQTMTKRPFLSQRAVVIVYFANLKLLDAADGLRGLAGVVAVPWIPGEADAWVARWGARVHGQTPQPAPSLIEDPVVVRALEVLTSVINLSTGLSHRSDKSRADETLRILRAKGHSDPTAVIKSWAIRNGWRPDHAEKLETLSRRIWALKAKPVLARIPGANDRYSRWADAARGS